jgi:hypothetical protein
MMAQTLSLRIRHELDAAYDGKVHNVFQVACEFHMNAVTSELRSLLVRAFAERFRIADKL